MPNDEKLFMKKYDDEGNELEPIEIRSKFEVCERCRGKGTHVNPSIDGNGLSREDFDDDPDFREDYFSGVYDVNCEECSGKRVVLIPNEEGATPEQLKLIEQYREQKYEKYKMDREDAAVRRAENGGRE